VFWSWPPKKPTGSDRKPQGRLDWSSGVDRLLPRTPSFDGYSVCVLPPEQAKQVLLFLGKAR